MIKFRMSYKMGPEAGFNDIKLEGEALHIIRACDLIGSGMQVSHGPIELHVRQGDKFASLDTDNCRKLAEKVGALITAINC